jgi:hypothetical protein
VTTDATSDPGFLGARPDRAAFAHSGASDLGTYGAASGAFVVLQAQPLPDFGTASTVSAESPAAQAPQEALVTSAPQVSTPESDSAFASFAGTSPTGSPAGLSHTAGTLAEPSPAGTIISPLIPLSFAQASPIDLALVQQHADGLKQAIAGLDLSTANEAAAGAAGSILAVQQQAADMIGSMNALLHDALASVQGTVLPAVDLIAPQLTAAVTGSLVAVTGLTAQVADDADALVGGITADLGDVVTGLEDTAASALTQTVSTLAPVTDTVAEPIEDLLSSLSGNDPIGGLATLTGLVTAADAFQLHDEAASDLHLSETLGVLGTLDLLAPPEAGDGLLGVLDPSHGLGDLAGHHDLDLGFG